MKILTEKKDFHAFAIIETKDGVRHTGVGDTIKEALAGANLSLKLSKDAKKERGDDQRS